MEHFTDGLKGLAVGYTILILVAYPFVFVALHMVARFLILRPIYLYRPSKNPWPMELADIAVLILVVIGVLLHPLSILIHDIGIGWHIILILEVLLSTTYLGWSVSRYVEVGIASPWKRFACTALAAPFAHWAPVIATVNFFYFELDENVVFVNFAVCAVLYIGAAVIARWATQPPASAPPQPV